MLSCILNSLRYLQHRWWQDHHAFLKAWFYSAYMMSQKKEAHVHSSWGEVVCPWDSCSVML